MTKPQPEQIADVPGIAAPMRRALSAAGYVTLNDVDGVPYEQLSGLHGVGQRGLERLQAALESAGMSLDGVTAESAKNAADIKTGPTDVVPSVYLATLEARRRAEGERLLELFTAETGAPAVMWGPSMIGFGDVHYTYPSGRQGDTFRVGFSPRSAKLSLYGLLGHARTDEFLSELGPHSLGKSCLYVTRLDRIDEDVLARLIRHSWESEPTDC